LQFGDKVLFESNNIVYSTEDIQEPLSQKSRFKSSVEIGKKKSKTGKENNV
jgi:hypothetical protein